MGNSGAFGEHLQRPQSVAAVVASAGNPVLTSWLQAGGSATSFLLPSTADLPIPEGLGVSNA